MVTIAIDAMGGDFGPAVVLEGANVAIELLEKGGVISRGSLRFLLFGDERKIADELEKYPVVSEISKIVHADIVVSNEMKPIDALRHRHDSNLGLAIEAVESGRADAVVSAANTGAYVALTKFILGTLPFVERPAIPAIMPNANGRSIVLDLGANLECSAEMLVQFALMGESLARSLLKKETPSVGLLNVGAEEMKGHAVVQTAGSLLRKINEYTRVTCRQDAAACCAKPAIVTVGQNDASVLTLPAVSSTTHPACSSSQNKSGDCAAGYGYVSHPYFDFRGFVEGNDIFKGMTDVVVTDGFSGNIALKSIEGIIWFFFKLFKDTTRCSLLGKIIGLAVLPTLRKIKKTIDPRLYNGAVLLGLKKIAVKSHGGADSFGFAQAIKVSIQMVQSDFLADVEKRLQLLPEVQ